MTVSFALFLLLLNVKLRKTLLLPLEPMDTVNPSLVDPASVSVIGAVDGQGTLQSPSFSGPAEKKQKKMEKEKATTSKAKSSTDKPAKPVSDSSRSARASTDSKIAELNQKWSHRFNRIEALLMARTLDREPTFQTVKVAPTHSPPAGMVRSPDPCIKPADRPSTWSTPSSDLPGTDSSAAKH